jgi:hypothetical protein
MIKASGVVELKGNVDEHLAVTTRANKGRLKNDFK